MFDILLWLGAALWILLFIQLLVNCGLTRDLSRAELQPLENPPFVSIVVPARLAVTEHICTNSCHGFPTNALYLAFADKICAICLTYSSLVPNGIKMVV